LDPINGKVNVIGTSAYYTCDGGRRLVGERIRRCVEESWSGDEPECHKQCLTKLSSPRYGSVVVADNKATYSCSHNYRIVGSAIRLCDKNTGVWLGNPSPPVCELECANLDNPANGEVSITGTTAHYRCNSGYKLKGNAARICENKKWTEDSPYCEKVCSPSVDSPLQGSVSVRDDTATYSCFVNYKIEGAAVRRCSNGEWLGETPKCVLECHPLKAPDNGVVTINGNTAHYKCNSNYSIEGADSRTCEGKTWTGSVPICHQICEDPPTLDNGFVSVVGRIATFSCQDHYKLIGNKVSHCDHGEWSSSFPSCILKCSPPFKPLNGEVSLEGTRATFKCHEGYRLIGSRTRECREDAWTGVEPSCQKDCPSMSHPDNGFVVVSEDTAIFECFPNYMLLGSKKMECNKQGEWIGVQPRCILSCTPYPLINGKFLLHRSTVVYQCDPGYVLVGDAISFCSNEKWTNGRGNPIERPPTCTRPDDILRPGSKKMF
jgi:CUB/sushi domain-containing protein